MGADTQSNWINYLMNLRDLEETRPASLRTAGRETEIWDLGAWNGGRFSELAPATPVAAQIWR
jgi:hypothetical protein